MKLYEDCRHKQQAFQLLFKTYMYLYTLNYRIIRDTLLGLFHAQPFLGFTKNGVKREKHSV